MARRAPYLAEIRHFVDSFLIVEDGGSRRKGREPSYADMVVDMLKFVGTPGAAGVLRDIATGMYGDERLRMAAAAALKEIGFLDEQEQLDVFVGGKWRKIVVVGHEIGGEYDLPEGAVALYRDAVEASRRGKLRKAEKLGRRLVERFPQCRQGYHNLAKALLDIGGRQKREEARRLLEKALDLDPSYVFPKITMANLLFTEGRMEEAEKALEGVDTAGDLKLPEEWAYFNVSKLRLVETRFVERLDALERGGAFGKEALDELETLASAMADITESLRKMREAGAEFELPPLSRIADRARQALASGALERNRALRSRIVGPGAAVREVLDGCAPRELRLIGRRIGLRLPAACRKKTLLDDIAQKLSDAETVGRLVEGLDREEMSICAALIEAGGAMDLVSFSRRLYRRRACCRGKDPGRPLHFRPPEVTAALLIDK